MNINLDNFLQKVFNLRKGEKKSFSLLFLHSFALGIFISVYFVPANAVFIQYFGGEYLPLAYIASGFVGYLTTSLYSVLQHKVTAQKLFLAFLSFIAIVTLLFWLFSDFFSEKHLAFFVFIFAAPLASLVGMISGGLSMQFLNMRQVKRLYGAINIGGISSAILGYIAIPIISPFLSHSFDLLLIADVGIIVSIFLLVYIYKKLQKINISEESEEEKTENIKFYNFLKQRYFILIFVVASLSTITIYFADFVYLASIKIQDQLISTPEEVAQFIALVCAAFKIGELILSLYSSRILGKHGVQMGLRILPTVSTILISLAAIISIFFGIKSIIFFAFIVLNKSLDRILRKGLDEPAFNVLFQPLPDNLKLRIQTYSGVIVQISSGIAGIILLLLGFWISTENGINLKYFTWIFLPLLLLWAFFSIKLYKAYKSQLKGMLLDISKSKKRDIFSHAYGDEILKKHLKEKNINTLKMTTIILSESAPNELEVYASSLLRKENTSIQNAVLRAIDPTWRQSKILKLINKLLKDKSKIKNITKELAEKAYCIMQPKELKEISEIKLLEICSSSIFEEQLLAVHYLLKHEKLQNEKNILALLDSKTKPIKTAAIKLVSKNHKPLLISKLIKLLEDEEFCHISTLVLLETGDVSIPELEKYFHHSINLQLLLRIIEIFAKIGSKRAKAILVKQINFPKREIQLAVIRGLYFCRYQASMQEISIISEKLKNVIENILWLLAALSDIKEEKNTLRLIQALDMEKIENYETLFRLLSFMFQPRIIELIKKNIIGENTIFALEIIDNFISPDIKQLIIPLFDNISDNQRIKKLKSIFPQEKMTFSQRLKSIVTRDFDKIDIWTVAKAIELFGRLLKRRQKKIIQEAQSEKEEIILWTKENVNKLLRKIRKSEIPDEVFVALYHKDQAVYEMAAKIIYDENPSRCFDYLSKISEEKQYLYSVLENPKKERNYLLNDKLKLLKRYFLFFSIPDHLLLQIAKIFKVKALKKGEILKFDISHRDDTFVILKGSFICLHDNEKFLLEEDRLILRGINIPATALFIEANENATILEANRYEYFNILLAEPEILQNIYDMLKL